MASNKKTFAIIGCGCLGLIAIGVAAVLILGAGVFGMLKKSEPYAHSLERVRNHPGAVEALGTPIEPGFLVSGNVSLSNNDGTAELNYGVSGPDAEGTVTVNATKTAGSWDYRKMTLDVAGSGESIDLLAAP